MVYWKDGIEKTVKEALKKYLVYEFEDLKVSEKIERIEFLNKEELEKKYEI